MPGHAFIHLHDKVGQTIPICRYQREKRPTAACTARWNLGRITTFICDPSGAVGFLVFASFLILKMTYLSRSGFVGTHFFGQVGLRINKDKKLA